MALLLNIVAGIIVLLAILCLPKLYRQKRAERLVRIQTQASGKLPSTHRIRENNRVMQFVHLLLLASLFFYFYVFNWLDDLSARLLTTRSQQLRIFYFSLIECAVLALVLVLVRELRSHPPNRLKSIASSLFGILPIIFFGAVLDNYFSMK